MLLFGYFWSKQEARLTTNNKSWCAIWPEFPAKEMNDNNSFMRRSTYYDSPRAGGKYEITEHAAEKLRYMDDGAETLQIKARLTTWLLEMRRKGEEWPLVTTDVVTMIESSQSLRIVDRAGRLLKYLARVAPNLGSWKTFGDAEVPSAMVHSESTDFNEVGALIDSLTRSGLIKSHVDQDLATIRLQLTVEGLALTEPTDETPRRSIGYGRPRHQA